MINIIKMLLLLGGAKELAPTEETFDNPPSVTDFTLTRHDHWTDVLEGQPAEIFNSPPSITDFSISQNIHETLVQEQPVETFNNPPSVSIFTLTQISS
jgi:hypothetical protein